MDSGADAGTFRVPPHNLEAEIAVLGAMLLNPECIARVGGVVTPQDFYKEGHRYIAEALFQLRDAATPITVQNLLHENGKLEQSGGFDFLKDLHESTVLSVGVERHARIIKQLSIRRHGINECATAIDRFYENEMASELILSDLRNRTRDLMEPESGDFVSTLDLCQNIFKNIQEMAEREDPYVGIQSGTVLDKYLYGFEPGVSYYLIARPSVGKSALALSIARGVADHGNVLYYSLESGDLALGRRVLAAESGVWLSKIRTGQGVTDFDWEYLTDGANSLSEVKSLFLTTRPKFKTIETLTASAEAFHAKAPVSLIVVDHIQRMRSEARKQSRHLEISWISERLSTLSQDLNIPILILCQLRRSPDQKNPKPRVDDMKESGDLEQNADVIIGLWRETNVDEYMLVRGLKGRDQGLFECWLKFDINTMTFVESSGPPKEEQPDKEDQRGYG